MSYPAVTPAPKGSDDELSVLHVDGMATRILRTARQETHGRQMVGSLLKQSRSLARYLDTLEHKSGSVYRCYVTSVSDVVSIQQTLSSITVSTRATNFRASLYEQIIPGGRRGRGRLTFRPRPRCRSRLKRPFTANRFLILLEEAFVSDRRQT